MAAAGFNKRFLETTRGQIVALLRRGTRTVEELAAALGLTDNAVRAHLAALERDGLVRQAGPPGPGARPPSPTPLPGRPSASSPRPTGASSTSSLRSSPSARPPRPSAGPWPRA